MRYRVQGVAAVQICTTSAEAAVLIAGIRVRCCEEDCHCYKLSFCCNICSVRAITAGGFFYKLIDMCARVIVTAVEICAIKRDCHCRLRI